MRFRARRAHRLVIGLLKDGHDISHAAIAAEGVRNPGFGSRSVPTKGASHMFRMALLCLASSVVFVGALARAQNIKQVPAKMTSASSGSEMYRAYCASCHGVSGKGDGPAAMALKKVPTDLTLLAQHNGGKFNDLSVIVAIKGDTVIPSHGSLDMPVWGQVFRSSVSHGDQADVQLRISNLTDYIRSLQVK